MSIGRSKERGDNQLMRHSQARRFMDARFVEVRIDGLARLASDPCAQVIFLQTLNRKWDEAVKLLVKALLPQRKRRLYRPIRTVNRTVGGKEKVRPRNSRKQKRLTRERRPRLRKKARKVWKKRSWKSAHTSHHQGHYVSQGRRGAPTKTDAEKKRSKERSKNRRRTVRQLAAAQAVKEGKRKSYKPRQPAKLLAAEKAKARIRSGRIKLARLAWRLKNELVPKWKDERPNHHPELGYKAPKPRQRATKKQAALGRKKHRTKAAKQAVGLLQRIAAKLHSNFLRSKHLRGYWAEIHKAAHVGPGK